MEAVRFKNVEEIEQIRRLLENDQPVLVAFCAQATRHPILLVPDTAIIHIGFGRQTYSGSPPGSYTYVGVMEFGRGLYPLSLGYVHPSYVGDKLGVANTPDAANITVFLNALGHASGVAAYLKTIPMFKDHVDYEEWSR